jgi:hypothetical protein
MTSKLQTPSVIGDVRHLALALHQNRVDIVAEGSNDFDRSPMLNEKIYAPPRQWVEIGGVTNHRAAAILKDFLAEFEAIKAERDRLKSALRQIAETAIKVGDV